jgi:hypothetical protein
MQPATNLITVWPPFQQAPVTHELANDETVPWPQGSRTARSSRDDPLKVLSCLAGSIVREHAATARGGAPNPSCRQKKIRQLIVVIVAMSRRGHP